MEDYNENAIKESSEEEAESAVQEEAVPAAQEQKSTVSEDGEYHYVKPEKRLYEDAGFVPQDETTDIPRYYDVPTEKQTKEKKQPKNRNKRFLKVGCLCLACAVIGGIAGGFVSWGVLNRKSAELPIETPKPISTVSNTALGQNGGSANDIYNIACKQAVGITTEVTFKNIFGQTSSTAVSGSGFVVTSDGYIVTNYHVIEYAYQYKYAINVLFKDGTSYEASIIGVEEDNDIAVLKIDATDLTPVTVGDSESLEVGDNVYVVGNPLGELDFSMTSGRVSALDRSIVADNSQPAINMFQVDAAVNSGNSGGPIYNESGEVIGVVTAKVNSAGVEGLGFAIPINDAIDIANDLITQGYVTGKAYMGVNVDTRYTSVYAQYYNMPEGAYIFNVEKDSCAEKCGIAAGDIITQLGEDIITSYTDLNEAIRQYKAGDSADVIVYRGNDYQTLSITFDESKPDADSNGVNESGISSTPQEIPVFP